MFGPLSSTIQGVVDFTWPMVLISTIIIVSFRIAYVIKNKIKFVLYQDLLMLAFIIYVLCLFQVVTFQDTVSWSSNNFIPFKEIFRYDFGSRLFIKNVVGNAVLFLPFGFFVSYYLKSQNGFLPFVLTLIASCSIETVQMLIGRVFDIDDILLNLVGGMLGFLIYYLLSKLSKKLPDVLKSDMVLNIIAVVLLIGIITLLEGEWYMKEFQIFNETEQKIKELHTVKKVLDLAIKKEKLHNVVFNVIIVDNNYIHELNKEYRHIDRETDVITFALEDNQGVVLPDRIRVLGDIYISIDKAKSQAEEYGHTLTRELSFLAVHGFYHLLGYDHQNKEEEKIMFMKQEEVLEEYGIKR